MRKEMSTGILKYGRERKVVLGAISSVQRILNNLGQCNGVNPHWEENKSLKSLEISSNLKGFWFPYAFFFDTLSGFRLFLVLERANRLVFFHCPLLFCYLQMEKNIRSLSSIIDILQKSHNAIKESQF